MTSEPTISPAQPTPISSRPAISPERSAAPAKNQRSADGEQHQCRQHMPGAKAVEQDAERHLQQGEDEEERTGKDSDVFRGQP